MQAATYERTAILSVGHHRDNPRIWLEGKYLSELGFRPGQSINVDYQNGRIVVTLDGSRKVSQHRNRSVIDMNTESIADAIGSADSVEVRCRYGVLEIVPAEVEAKRLKRQKRPGAGTVGSIFSGGGLLDQAATQAGLTPTFAVEINEEYANLYADNHPTAEMFQGSISDIPMKDLPEVEVLVGGIPCEPFSQARRNQGSETALPCDHALYDMTVWALMAIRAANPRVIVLEEVPGYLNDPAYKILAACLRRMGYRVESRIINGTEYGSLCVRKRAVIVAKSGDSPINWPKVCSNTRTLGDILLPPNDSRCKWFDRTTKPWIFKHWEEQSDKGNGFKSTVLTKNSTTVPAITKRYFAEQGGNPVVAHPSRSGVYRWLTVVEVQRLMGLPDTYQIGEDRQTAGEIMGQGVLVDVFTRIIQAVIK